MSKTAGRQEKKQAAAEKRGKKAAVRKIREVATVSGLAEEESEAEMRLIEERYPSLAHALQATDSDRSAQSRGKQEAEGSRQSLTIPLLYLLGIAGAEAVTVLGNAVGGMVCHVVILFALVLNSSLVADSPYRKLYVALTLAPLIRIVSLAMPLEEFSTIYQYLIVSLPLLVGIFAAVRILNLKPPDVSLSLGKLHIQGLVALTGVGFALAEYYILRPEPLISALTWQAALVPALIFLVAVGFIEELAFRGVIQHCSTEAIGSWGWVYVAVLFAVLHMGYLSPMHVLLVLFVGLFFGWVVKKTGSLVGVTLSHGIINIGLYLIVPLLISEGFLPPL